jgi:hypothetical protein
MGGIVTAEPTFAFATLSRELAALREGGVCHAPCHGNVTREGRSLMRLPSIQFYVGDWLRDPQLGMASPASRGIWIDLLCHQFDAPTRGIIVGNAAQLQRLTRSGEHDFATFLDEIERLKFGDLSRESNGVIRIVNRRMVRDEKARKDAAIRQRRHREGAASQASHAGVTSDVTGSVTPSSQRSSSSSSKIESATARSKPRKPEIPIPANWVLTADLREYARQHGRDPDLEAERFKKHAQTDDVRHRDWNAAFQKWCLSPYGRGANGNGKVHGMASSAPSPRSLTEYLEQEGKL